MIRLAAHIALLCAAVTGIAPQASADDLVAGAYKLAGATAAGDDYLGKLSIAPDGPSFRLRWDRPLPLERRGYALRLDDVVGVVADDPSADYGIVLYRVRGGHLEGYWSSDPGTPVKRLGTEHLDGPAGLEGNFGISLGLNPDGTHYSGRVEIKRVGTIYLVDWYTPEPRYIGTGVMMGDIFVVGYGESHRSGVAAYCVRSVAAIEGITGSGADTAVGAELLWPEAGPAPSDPPARLARLRSRGTADCGAPVAGSPEPPATLRVTSR